MRAAPERTPRDARTRRRRIIGPVVLDALALIGVLIILARENDPAPDAPPVIPVAPVPTVIAPTLSAPVRPRPDGVTVAAWQQASRRLVCAATGGQAGYVFGDEERDAFMRRLLAVRTPEPAQIAVRTARDAVRTQRERYAAVQASRPTPGADPVDYSQAMRAWRNSPVMTQMVVGAGRVTKAWRQAGIGPPYACPLVRSPAAGK